MMRVIVLGLFFILAIFVEQSVACSCAASPTVDVAFEKTPNVVVMKLRSVEKVAEGEKRRGYGGIKMSRLTVEKVYKGSLKPGQELTFAQGGGADCIWTFSEAAVGTEFLFYLGAKPFRDDLWLASTCTRSGSAKARAADLLYLENVKKFRGKTRISGMVTQTVGGSTEERPATEEFLSGRSIFVKGNGKSVELKTDRNGVYEIYDLPAGKYRITPEPIAGYSPFYGDKMKWFDLEIKPGGHAEQHISFDIDNAIRGRFFDANGKALENVCLNLVPASGTKERYFYEGDCTEADGSFKFEDVPEGSYVIVVNDDGGVTSNEPFGTFYYPSALRREEAGEIYVAPGTVIENLTIVAPQTAEVVNISGTLLVEDGKPITKDFYEYAAVEFIAESDKEANEDRPSSRATVDENGRFTLKILKGQKGKLYGTMMTYPGEYVNCPKIEKLIPKKDGVNIADLKTPELFVNVENDQSEIELRFPFPACKKAEID